MEVIQIVGLAITATLLITTIKAKRPEIAVQTGIITGIVIFILLAAKISAVIELISSYSSKAGINSVYINILLKVIGIAYITEFGSEICRDAGETAISSKIELAGKVVIIVMAVPIITSLLDLTVKLL